MFKQYFIVSLTCLLATLTIAPGAMADDPGAVQPAGSSIKNDYFDESSKEDSEVRSMVAKYFATLENGGDVSLQTEAICIRMGDADYVDFIRGCARRVQSGDASRTYPIYGIVQSVFPDGYLVYTINPAEFTTIRKLPSFVKNITREGSGFLIFLKGAVDKKLINNEFLICGVRAAGSYSYNTSGGGTNTVRSAVIRNVQVHGVL